METKPLQMNAGAESLSPASDAPPIALTPAAVKKVRELAVAENAVGKPLRVGVKGGGCSGLSYTLTFENEPGPHDQLFEFDGLRVLLDPKSALYITGITLDFSDALVGGGFKFGNPNAKRSCGCGESFSA